MPNLIEFLIAPWRILLALSSDPTGARVALSASGQPLPPGALCSFQDVGGGQLVNTCHVLGYEMPSFIFWASMLILTLFVAASLSLLYQCTKVAVSLARLTQQLEKLPKAKGEGLDEQHLESIRALMQKEALTQHLWERFEETLLVSPEGEEIYATQPFDTIFSKAALIEENVQSALFNAIPGVLTGVGLLMTFVAILDGLSHVTVTANMDVKGIGGLINGLSGKFVSSIVAVSCAVLFVFVERLAYSRPLVAYRDLHVRISARFRRRTVEQLLYQLLQQSPSLARRGRVT